DSAPTAAARSGGDAGTGPRRRSGWFGNRRVRTKILCAIGVMALVAIASTLVAVNALNSSDASLKALTSEQNDVMAPLSLIHQNELKARALIAMATLDPSDSAVADSKEAIAETDAETDEAIATVDAALTASDPEHWAGFKDAWTSFKDLRDTVLMQCAASGNRDGYQAAYADQVKPAASAMADNLDAIEAAAADRFADQATAAGAAKQSSIVVIFLVL